MKKIILIGLGVLSLSACDTLSNIQMPDMTALNPFSGQAKSAESTAAQPAQSSSAIDIEMAEMERLMGKPPRPDLAQTATTAPIDDPVEPVESDMPSAPVEPVAQIDTNAPIPAEKPSYTAKAAIEPTPVAKVAEPAQIQAPTPAPAPAPIPAVETAAVPEPEQTPEPAPAPMPSPEVTERDIPERNAVAPTAATTSDIAIFNEQDLILSSASGCPMIEILPAGRSITYFENELSGSMVARAVINEIKGGCEIVDGGLELDLDIFMDGKISDKGRFEGNQDMEAFMTFPYFVAISDPQGLPVDKKILATAMRFKPVINDLKHAEKITQFIPMDDTSNAANYKILVGFQLSRKQLEYNRARTVNRVDNKRISPDTIPAARRSTNPLAD